MYVHTYIYTVYTVLCTDTKHIISLNTTYLISAMQDPFLMSFLNGA